MSETVRHTPGPWVAKWSKYDEGVVIVQAGMPTNRVLASFDGDGDGPDEQSLADAHLIAAAPEMLAALRVVAGSDNWRCFVDEEWDIVNDAIYKAEGRS